MATKKTTPEKLSIDEALGAVRKADYLRWAGRDHAAVDRQIERLAIPIKGGEGGVNVPELVRWLHDFLARYDTVLMAARAEETNPGTATLTGKLRAVDLERKKIELAVLKGQLARVDVIGRMLVDFGSAVRRSLEQVQANVGPEPLRPVIETMELELARWAKTFATPPELMPDEKAVKA